VGRAPIPTQVGVTVRGVSHTHARPHAGHAHTGHPNAGHAHTGHLQGPPTSHRRLLLALGLILGFMAVEVLAGILAHSLALLSDAAHMLTDAVALGLSIVALRLAARPAQGAMTYGFQRVEVLAAQANGVTLLVIAALVVYSAVGRLISPPSVSAWTIVIVALAGIAVNGAATAALSGAGREAHMSVEGSFQHILTDLFAFIGTAVAGGIILLTGFERADPIASLLVAALMLHSALELLRDSGRVFLEAAPRDLDPHEIGHALATQPQVVEVHDLHIWELTAGFPALSAHVLVARDADCHAARRKLEELLRERFGIDHTTLQVDHDGGRELIELKLPGESRR
jgi:cobalt-zinc-cadmium efflux system protein